MVRPLPFAAFALITAVACGDSVIVASSPGSGGGPSSSAGGGLTSPAVSVTSTGGATSAVTVSTSAVGGAPNTTSVVTSSSSGGDGAGGGCVDVTVPLEPARDTPVDLVVAVVNSSLTANAISAVEQSLAGGLTGPLTNDGIDLRTILVSRHGTFSTSTCMPPPLGDGNCTGPAVVGSTFRQYSATVPLGGVLCALRSTIDGTTPDDFGAAPGGWQTWLRPPAFKAFLIFDVNGVGCFDGSTFLNDQDDDPNGQQVALAFDGALLGDVPGQFGTTAARRYAVYFAGGFAPLDAGNTGIGPGLPTQTATCSGQFANPGTGYQWLSRGTDALRFSGCNNVGLGAVFSQTADDIAARVTDRCRLGFDDTTPISFPLVALEPDDPNQPSVPFTAVPDASACGVGQSFYFVGPDELRLCPAACDVAENTPGPLSLTSNCGP
ncbi:MAG: hypothetical protein AAGN82_09555 [Myxococcota bacterium]